MYDGWWVACLLNACLLHFIQNCKCNNNNYNVNKAITTAEAFATCCVNAQVATTKLENAFYVVIMILLLCFQYSVAIHCVTNMCVHFNNQTLYVFVFFICPNQSQMLQLSVHYGLQEFIRMPTIWLGLLKPRLVLCPPFVFHTSWPTYSRTIIKSALKRYWKTIFYVV